MIEKFRLVVHSLSSVYVILVHFESSEYNGLAWLKTLVEESRDDYSTFDILKVYYQDEEEDMYRAEQQLELIEKIGLQNWLKMQV